MYETWKVVVISLLISVFTALFICTFFYFFVIPYFESKKEIVEVPNIVGMAKDEATLVLGKKGLLMHISEEKEDLNVPEGKIISQDPFYGFNAKKGDLVKVVISLGSLKMEVPDLTGIPLSQAFTMLERLGLKLGNIRKTPSDNIPKECIISTEPESGTKIGRSSSVNLIVSEGKEEVTVPRLYGKNLTRAQTLLESCGLKVGRINYTTSEEYSFDIIIGQHPRAGTKVKRGSSVSITINKEAY